MFSPIFILAFASACLQVFPADAQPWFPWRGPATVYKTFIVENLTLSLLCKPVIITAVNGTMPGPTIEVIEGDRLVIDIINRSPYNITIHWHGVHQRLTPWYDGPEMITQCPIRTGQTFRNDFTVSGQEGTLWWHAHISNLRATVYGAFVIRPRYGPYSYPFPKPDFEVPILIGEWWNQNVVDLEEEAFRTGKSEPTISNAFTINGLPGDLYAYSCSMKHTYTLDVVPGKTYLLRIINAALNSQHFFQIANHTFTVVAVDASYTEWYSTDLIVIASGQTVDALMVADARPASYYMAARQFSPTYPSGPKIDDTTATAIVQYPSANQAAPPVMPDMVPINDPSGVGVKFYTQIKCQVGVRFFRPVPQIIDESMFITVNMGRKPCQPAQTKCVGYAVAASMNNVSFVQPTNMSLLEAFYKNVKGVYTADFPDNPPVIFDYTNQKVADDPQTGLMFPEKGTKVKHLMYGARVQIVLQNTAILGTGYHPMHLHGYNFFVIAQGFGNYDSSKVQFNLLNPQVRNTIAVPAGGWAVIRFVADNPGMWYMHCHIESHIDPGLMMAFEVENGGTPYSTIIPPPPDFPTC